MAETRGLVVTSKHTGDGGFTITTFVPPRRNGGPNCGAYGAAMVALASVNPDAYDPEPVIELAEGVTATVIPHALAAEVIRDRVIAADEDEVEFPRACPTGGCGDE